MTTQSTTVRRRRRASASALTGSFAAIPGSAGAGQHRLPAAPDEPSATPRASSPASRPSMLLDAEGRAAADERHARPARARRTAVRVDLSRATRRRPTRASRRTCRARPSRTRGQCEPKAYTLRLTIGDGTVDAPIAPPTPVCERGTLQYRNSHARRASRLCAGAALHQPHVRAEADLLVERVRVARVQHPAAVRRTGPFSTISRTSSTPRPAAAMRRRARRRRRGTRSRRRRSRPRARSRPGAPSLVEPDDAVARVDQLVLPRARSSLRPVRLAAEVRVHGVAVEPRRGRRRARSRRRGRASRAEASAGGSRRGTRTTP